MTEKTQSIRQQFQVRPIPPEHARMWAERKHYAHLMPPNVLHTFGLYDADLVQIGACVYSLPPRHFNNGYGVFGNQLSMLTMELTRLVVNEGHPKNALSFFVSRTFRLLPKPCCLVSYADQNWGHHGYIYQATNWVYTGMSDPAPIFMDMRSGKRIHPRTIFGWFGTCATDKMPEYIEVSREENGKHRYFQFLGNKQEVASMKLLLDYTPKPYPKGDNKRYDATTPVDVQLVLF